jgi:transcriptional regulator with XRE-family HTH domain
MKTRKKIAKRRRKLGLTQYKLADKVGYSRSAISNWETGARPLFPEHIRAIARALHTRPGALS